MTRGVAANYPPPLSAAPSTVAGSRDGGDRGPVGCAGTRAPSSAGRAVRRAAAIRACALPRRPGVRLRSRPFDGDRLLVTGRVGGEVSVEQAYEAARATGLSILASLKLELDDLDRVAGWIKALGCQVRGGIQRDPGGDQGFSDLILTLGATPGGTRVQPSAPACCRSGYRSRSRPSRRSPDGYRRRPPWRDLPPLVEPSVSTDWNRVEGAARPGARSYVARWHVLRSTGSSSASRSVVS